MLVGRISKPMSASASGRKASIDWAVRRWPGAVTSGARLRNSIVPRAWVTEIRETMYGPEGSNPLYDQFLAAHGEIAALHEELTTLRKDHFALAKRALESGDRVRRRCDDIDGKISELRLLAKRVEREISR